MQKFNHTIVRSLIVAASALAGCTSSAAEYTVAVQAEITSVSDDLNWFNNSIQVGMLVAGTYNFFDSGFQRLNSPPSSSFYQYELDPDPASPAGPVNLHLSLGGRNYQTAPGFFFYGIDITNNSDGLALPGSDSYVVQSPLGFPTHFNDLAGDPVLDPGFNFFPILGMVLKFTDSTGTVFSSTDLPLTVPSLGSFDSATGQIFIADGNGEPDYAVAEFRITGLQAVPEPSAFAAVGAAALVAVKRRHRVAR